MAKTALLSHFFSNQAFIDILLFFLLQPGKECYLNQVKDGTGKALLQVQRTIKRLSETGLIQKSSHHNRIYYKADHKHIAYEEMRQLIIKAKIFSDLFKVDLERLEDKICYGFIYGSVAKGTNTEASDIDIFFIGNLTYHELSPFIFNLSRELVQEVNAVIFTPQEFCHGIKDKNPFIMNVLQEPKIWLFGDKYEFEAAYR